MSSSIYGFRTSSMGLGMGSGTVLILIMFTTFFTADIFNGGNLFLGKYN
jgi:hypothetical protein